MALTDEQKEHASNLRTEYVSIEAYHRALVHYRFIIVGAYFAGVSFLARAAIEATPSQNGHLGVRFFYTAHRLRVDAGVENSSALPKGGATR